MNDNKSSKKNNPTWFERIFFRKWRGRPFAQKLWFGSEKIITAIN